MASADRRLAAVERRIAKLKLPERTRENFSAYRNEPEAFVREVLGAESSTRRSDASPYQFEILRSLVREPRVAVLAGHGVGKSTLLSWAALWFLLTRPLSRVAIVAPEFNRQVRGVNFAEMRKWVRRALQPLPVDVLAGRAAVHGFGPEWGVVGLPATEPSRIEGLHAEGGLLLLLDECKGISQEVVDALMGALTGGEDSRLLVASTPGGASGPLWRACSDGSGFWAVHRLSSEDSSRVSPQWCEDRAAEWGRESALYQSRVQGRFADAGEGQLFGLSLLARALSTTQPNDGPVTLGVDVARSVAGDQNCVCVCRGGRVERFVLWRSPDLMATVARVVHEVTMTNPRTVRVDAGGVGGGVVDRLRQLRFPVEAVHFGGAARDSARFRNARAEMYWRLREGLERDEISLPENDALLADLGALRYGFDQSGRVLLETKDEARRRLGRSPDRADALVLATALGTRRPLLGPMALPDSSFPPGSPFSGETLTRLSTAFDSDFEDQTHGEH